MKCDEIFAALAMLEKERGIPQDFMMNKIVQALTTAYKRDHEGVENVVVEVNEEKRDLKMFVQKEIVEEVENPGSQISLEEARRISAKYELGGMVRFPVENVEFGRIAAGNGKQVIIQGLREAEHGMIYDEWGSKQHEILTGTVSRIDPRSGNVYLRIGTGNEATEGILSLNEQVSTETYTEGQLLKVYLVEVRRGTRGPQVMVSRTHPGLQPIVYLRRDGRLQRTLQPTGLPCLPQTLRVRTDVHAPSGLFAGGIQHDLPLRGLDDPQQIPLIPLGTAPHALALGDLLHLLHDGPPLRIRTYSSARDTGLISILYPVSRAARRAFCPSLPMARLS